MPENFDDDHEKSATELLAEAKMTVDIVLEERQKTAEQLKAQKPDHPQEWEYYLASVHRDYETILRQASERNPKVWEIYQQRLTDNPDRLALDKARAKRDHPTLFDRAERQQRTTLERLQRFQDNLDYQTGMTQLKIADLLGEYPSNDPEYRKDKD